LRAKAAKPEYNDQWRVVYSQKKPQANVCKTQEFKNPGLVIIKKWS